MSQSAFDCRFAAGFASNSLSSETSLRELRVEARDYFDSRSLLLTRSQRFEAPQKGLNRAAHVLKIRDDADYARIVQEMR